jgi:CO/xanthine dehydrogenase FAD-binding subunit
LSEASIAGCGEAARAEVDPWDDIHASSAYRRALVGHLVEQALRRAMASAHEA